MELAAQLGGNFLPLGDPALLGIYRRHQELAWTEHLVERIENELEAAGVLGRPERVYALAQRTALILFWVGFFALFRGFSQIMLAFGVRHAGEEAAAALDAAGPGVGTGQPSTGGAS